MKREDDLDTIAADLDSVLERLAGYIERQAPRPGVVDDEPVELKNTAESEILAAILYRYAMGPPRLRDAITATQAASDSLERKRESLVAEHGEKKAELLAALYACELAQRFTQPVPKSDARALAAAGNRYAKGHDKFFGGDTRVEKRGGGDEPAPLHPPNKNVPRLANLRKWAVEYAARLHEEDPKRYPIGRALFEEVTKTFTTLKAGTVEADYQSSAWPEIFRLRKQKD